ncbi:hypothetical protein D3C85_1176450 [compost metagenome]
MVTLSGTFKVNLPSLPVDVLTLVPFAATVAPGSGKPDSSTTKPVMVLAILSFTLVAFFTTSEGFGNKLLLVVPPSALAAYCKPSVATARSAIFRRPRVVLEKVNSRAQLVK